MPWWGALIATIASILGGGVLLSKIIRRSSPGTHIVLVRGGEYKLNKNTELTPVQQNGIDNAKLYAGKWGFVGYPYYEAHSISVAPDTYAIDIPCEVKRVVDGVEELVNCVMTLQPTYSVIESTENGINYAARADRNGMNGVKGLTQSTLKTAFGHLRNMPGVYFDNLNDQNFVFTNLARLIEDKSVVSKDANGRTFSFYGCQLIGLASMLVRTPMAVYNDGERAKTPAPVAVIAQETL